MSNQAILNTQNRISCTITCYSSKKFENSFLAELNNSDLFCFVCFFYQGFLSRTLATHKTAGEGRGPSYSTLQLPPAHEHPDIYLQLRWDLPPYRVTIWLIDDVILSFVCLYVELMLGFVTAIWHEKLVDSNSNRLSSLY